MSGDGRKALSPGEANELGEQRESWCAVELKKEQSWCRKERQHYDEILKSTVFDVHRPVYETRCTFEVNAPTHRERRHFQQQFESSRLRSVGLASNPSIIGNVMHSYQPNQHLEDIPTFYIVWKTNLCEKEKIL